jgi:hypothetical protein
VDTTQSERRLGGILGVGCQQHLKLAYGAGGVALLQPQLSQPLVQLMQHLVNHGTHHRGQATTMRGRPMRQRQRHLV